MAEPLAVPEPYVAPEQRHEAAFLGMYLFLASEVMLFGGIFGLAFGYRTLHPAQAILASMHLQLWIAAANTALILTSSLAVAIAVLAARQARRRMSAAWLGVAIALGLTFLALKGWEYWLDYRDGLMPVIGQPSPLRREPAALFLDLYFAATGLHAFHMSVGLVLLAWQALAHLRRPQAPLGLEVTGLYWHFVDVAWIFVFAIFYLVRP
jgi:cytochrome c oxidase subunit 3